MAIIIENAPRVPELIYNKVFLTSLRIDQQSSVDDAAMPLYRLTIEYRLYAVDDNQQRHFAPKVNCVKIENYMETAIIKAQSGDPDLLNALGAIQLALANILEDQTELGTAQVV